MTVTFSTNKDLLLPGNGDYVNTWNIPVNGDMSIIDAAFGGTTNLNATSGSVTLLNVQYQKLILNVTGSIAADVTYTIPSGVGGQWVVRNATTGNQNIVIASGGAGASATVLPGLVVTVACDGTNCYVVTASIAPTGGGVNQAFYLNDITVTTDYTIPTGKNAGTFGPVTINSGITVTIPSGSYWSIV
jgi:hypothetical protein